MSQSIDWTQWEPQFAQFLSEASAQDAAHDREHIRRVVGAARQLAAAEGADLAVVVPAAWLHDCVVVPKDSPQRSQASTLAAVVAGGFLRSMGYPETHLAAIEHAIAAHSFSANIQPRTVEARVVQDADRLDAIGAIGVELMHSTPARSRWPTPSARSWRAARWLWAGDPAHRAPADQRRHDQSSKFAHRAPDDAALLRVFRRRVAQPRRGRAGRCAAAGAGPRRAARHPGHSAPSRCGAGFIAGRAPIRSTMSGTSTHIDALEALCPAGLYLSRQRLSRRRHPRLRPAGPGGGGEGAGVCLRRMLPAATIKRLKTTSELLSTSSLVLFVG